MEVGSPTANFRVSPRLSRRRPKSNCSDIRIRYIRVGRVQLCSCSRSEDPCVVRHEWDSAPVGVLKRRRHGTLNESKRASLNDSFILSGSEADTVHALSKQAKNVLHSENDDSMLF